MTAKKSRISDKYTTKPRQKIPLTRDGFDKYVLADEKKDGKVKKKVYTKKELAEIKRKEKEEANVKAFHAGGPIINNVQEIPSSYLGVNGEQYSQEQIDNWKPHNRLSVFDTGKEMPLTAAESTNRQKQQNWAPQYFVNPMQDLDLIVVESVLKNTFVGPLMNALTKFIVGTGMRPELEVLEPKGDEEDQKEIDNNQHIIKDLLAIDKNISSDDARSDVPFIEKIAALIDVTNSFNRGALIFGYDRPVEVNGVKYKEIPSSLKFAHPRDLGIIKVSDDSWALESFQWRPSYYMIESSQAIYTWNPLISAKIHNSWLYGGSLVLPMLDAARVMRKVIAVDFPAIAEASWGGAYVITVKPQGQTAAQKQAEYQKVASGIVRGGVTILMEDKEDVSFNQISFDPKIQELETMLSFLIKHCVASLGLPNAMFFDEQSSTRDTLLGKLQFAISTVINPMRETLGRQICAQWYARWFKVMYGEKEEYKKFRIKIVWDDLHIESFIDRIEAVNEVDSRKQLTDEAYGELASIDNYEGKVDTDAETVPGGDQKKMSIPDGQGGETQIKQKKPKGKPQGFPPGMMG